MEYPGTSIYPDWIVESYESVIVSKALGKIKGRYKRFLTQADRTMLINSFVSLILTHTLLNSWIFDRVVRNMEITRNIFLE